MLTLPLAITPLAGLPLFVLALPTLAIVLLSSNPLMRQLETYHYAAPALAFVMLAVVDGVSRVSTLKQQIGRVKTIYWLSSLVLVSSLIYHYYRGYSPLGRDHFIGPR